MVLERCCDFYAVRQGILKAGGAFAVAAPDYPDDRVQFIFEDAGVPFIITTKEIAKDRQELFSRLSCTVLLLKNCWKIQMPGTRIPGLRNMIFATVFTPPVLLENQKVL